MTQEQEAQTQEHDATNIATTEATANIDDTEGTAAENRDFDILNVSFVNLIAYTSEPNVPPAVAIPVTAIPSKVEPGTYINLSPVLKLSLGMVS